MFVLFIGGAGEGRSSIDFAQRIPIVFFCTSAFAVLYLSMRSPFRFLSARALSQRTVHKVARHVPMSMDLVTQLTPECDVLIVLFYWKKKKLCSRGKADAQCQKVFDQPATSSKAVVDSRTTTLLEDEFHVFRPILH